jgi:hypothetical protein
MKKITINLVLILTFAFSQSQNIYTYGFDGTSADLITNGWQRVNLSNPVNPITLWSIPSAATSTFNGASNSGSNTSFAIVNFRSIADGSSGTISNWLISPIIRIKNGDVVTFYTRIGRNGAATRADNLELRISSNGSTITNPASSELDTGSFTTLAVSINPNLDLISYPFTWTQYSYTVTGIPEETDCKIAFRYFVLNGGQASVVTALNSDLIGIDTFSVDRPVFNTNDFFINNFKVYPNPTNDILNINNINNININSVQITDLNGRLVNETLINGNPNFQININSLSKGLYILKINTDRGVGVSKIIKQ